MKLAVRNIENTTLKRILITHVVLCVVISAIAIIYLISLHI